MLVYLCSNSTWFQRYNGNPSECISPVGNFLAGCESVLFAWAHGMGSMTLPKEAGFRVGDSGSHPFKYMVIEIHYDNPLVIPGQRDYSGVRLHWTPQLRQYDAGILVIGDPIVSGHTIPPQSDSFEQEFECTTACTNTFSSSITVFSDFSHMHEIGKQMWTTHWRGNTKLGEINRVDFFDFGFQQATPINVVIKPGDRLNTHCVYDSSQRSGSTIFGISSTDEMCMSFLSYYPALPDKLSDVGPAHFSFCGYASNEWRFGYERNYTMCGDALVGTIQEYNPTITDQPGGINRSFGKRPDQCVLFDSETCLASVAGYLYPQYFSLIISLFLSTIVLLI